MKKSEQTLPLEQRGDASAPKRAARSDKGMARPAIATSRDAQQEGRGLGTGIARAPGAIDWEAVRRDFATGKLSQKELATKHGISDTTLARRMRIDRERNPAAWQRDLSGKVKQATAALLLQEAAQNTVRAGQEAAAVMAAAALTRDVILGHRADTKAARGLMARLLGELEACTLRPDALAALLEKAGQDLDAAGRLALRAQVAQLAQLHNRVGSMRQLADTLGKLHTAERKAFGIQDDEGGSDPLDNATEAELEAELAALEAQTAAPGLRLVG